MTDKPTNAPKPAKRFDMNALRRLCFWGGAATVALTVVAVTTQTNIGTQRLQVALKDARQSSDTLAAIIPIPAAKPAQDDTRQLAETVQSLKADRDRLAARLALLERNLTEMTGSIAKRTDAAAPEVRPDPAAAPPPPALAAAPATVPSATISNAASPPADAAGKAAATPAQGIPLPPVRAQSARDAPDAKQENTPGPTRSEFGVDLGGAPSLASLRRQWAAIKANHGPLLAGLHPVAASHERSPGVVDYRLVVGPFANAADAARLCARLAAARVFCRTADYNGQRLAQR